MKTFKYSIVILALLAAVTAFAGNTDDKYGFKFVKKKLYSGHTDKWIYDIYKNDEVLKRINVYVNTEFEGSRMLVEFKFSNSRNEYFLTNNSSVDNFRDVYRSRDFTVNSLKEAVDLSVAHYIQDQIAE